MVVVDDGSKPAAVVSEGDHGANWNHRRAIVWTAERTCRVVVLEDDALPVHGFTEKITEWLTRFPDDMLSFYLGTGRPPQYQKEIAACMIEQGRIIARDEAVKDTQAQAGKSAATAAGLSATINQLRTEATKLATRLDAAKHTANLAAAVRSKTAGADAAVLADMLGRLAEEARYYAERSDESYRAGITCERVYDSVKESNNSRFGDGLSGKSSLSRQ